ncbi:MAG: hypothetical protein WBD31_09645 [Rubripirellula sp.]
MIRSVSPSGYSSVVRINLRVGDQIFNVAQLHDKVCLVRNPGNVEPGPAELSIVVDGKEQTETVMLRNGIRAESREVCFE